MFTSRRFAPPRTWSSATSRAPWKSPASIRRRKSDEPVTFVRSPIIVKLASSKIAKGSRPLKRVMRCLSGTRLGARHRAVSAMALTWSGVVPQQPPTTFTSPASANSLRKPLVSFGSSS